MTYQHLRCDFSYEGDDPRVDGIYCVHPEFLDDAGEPIKEGVSVPLTGRASMWIVFPEMRARVHRRRLEPGVVGYFMEGARRIGCVKVERIVGFHTNGGDA